MRDYNENFKGGGGCEDWGAEAFEAEQKEFNYDKKYYSGVLHGLIAGLIVMAIIACFINVIAS